MSFDLFLQRFEGGSAAHAGREDVLAVVRRHRAEPPDEFGFYVVGFSDGSSVELSAKELERDGDFLGCAFHMHDFTPLVIAFVFAVARAGDFTIVNAQGADDPESPLLILTDPAQAAHLPQGLAEHPATCESAQRLAELLGP